VVVFGHSGRLPEPDYRSHDRNAPHHPQTRIPYDCPVIIPLSTELRLPRPPIVTTTLVAVTIGAHFALEILTRLDPAQAEAIRTFGQVWRGPPFQWWGLVTSAFLHAGWIHLLGNMVFLWVFGPSVEDRYGRIGFLAFYFAGAAVSGWAHIAFEPMPAIGASGAIAAVTGAFIVLFPHTLIRCLWIFGLTIINAPAWWVIGLGILWNLFASTFGLDAGVATIAHLGGYAFGIALTMLLLWRGVFPRQPYDLFTWIRQAQRRRALRSATAVVRGPTLPEKAVRSRDSHRSDAVAKARAEVSRLMSLKDLPAAEKAYAALVRDHADAAPALLTLPRATQYELATHLYAQGRHAQAADAFARLLTVYPNDPEADQIRLLLARMYLRRLGRPDEAATLLNTVIESSRDDEMRALAEREIADIQA